MKQPSQDFHQKFLNGVRKFNKHIFNRFTLLFAESKIGPFSVLYHRGRTSGRVYRTPVVATYIGETIIISLSYGEHVDWLRNVLAADGCEIVRQHKRTRLTNPKVIDATTAFDILPENRRKLYDRFKMKKFLLLYINE